MKTIITLLFTLLLFVRISLSQENRFAKDTLSVDFSNIIQSDFLGLGSVYHGFSFMPESEKHGMNEKMRKIEFERIARSNLKLVRTWYGIDWAMPVWGGPYNWNSVKMEAFYKWLQAMKDRNIDVAINAGWWFTAHTYSNGLPKDGNPGPANEDIYINWVSESLNQLINVKGFTNIKYVFGFTEPGDYCGCGTIPEGFTQLSYYTYVLKKLNAKLIKDGRREQIKIVGPNVANAMKTREWLQYCKDNLNDVIDIYSSHDYTLSFDQTYHLIKDCVNDIAATGKPFWYDEYGYMNKAFRQTADYGTYIAALNTSAINAKAQSTQMWLYMEQFYVSPLDSANNNGTDPDPFNKGKHEWGVMPWIPENKKVYPSYYLLNMMAKYLRGPSAKIFKSTDNKMYTTKIVALQQSNGEYTFMVTNTNASPHHITVSLSNNINKTLYRHLYDPANLPSGDKTIGISKKIINVTDKFSDIIPAGGVAIYTTIKD